jgi:hypothetical protein
MADGRDDDAVATVRQTLREAPVSSAGWLLPVDPLLHVQARAALFAPALAALRARAG